MNLCLKSYTFGLFFNFYPIFTCVEDPDPYWEYGSSKLLNTDPDQQHNTGSFLGHSWDYMGSNSGILFLTAGSGWVEDPQKNERFSCSFVSTYVTMCYRLPGLNILPVNKEAKFISAGPHHCQICNFRTQTESEMRSHTVRHSSLGIRISKVLRPNPDLIYFNLY